MNNNQNRDHKIHNKLSEDKIITDSTKNVIQNYIPNERIKPKMISQSQKSFFIFIIIISLILVAFLLYLFEINSEPTELHSDLIFENSVEILDKTYKGENSVENDNEYLNLQY